MGESAFVAWAGEAGLVGNVRHFPILVMTLYGTLTEQLVDQYGEWVAQTIALGRDRNSPFVVVVGTRQAGGPQARCRDDARRLDGSALGRARVRLEQDQLDVPTTIGHDYVAPVSPPRTG